MNNQKKIEQCLRSAQKPQVPEGLLEKLQMDISANNIKTQQSALRRWFAPTGELISPWRVAAVVAIAAMVLLPLTYAGGKAIKNYFVETIEVTESIVTEDGSVTKVGTMSVVMTEPVEQPNEEEAKEIEELKKAGKFEKVFVEEWVEKGMTFRLYKVSYTLSSGKVITKNEINAGTSINKSEQ